MLSTRRNPTTGEVQCRECGNWFDPRPGFHGYSVCRSCEVEINSQIEEKKIDYEADMKKPIKDMPDRELNAS